MTDSMICHAEELGANDGMSSSVVFVDSKNNTTILDLETVECT